MRTPASTIVDLARRADEEAPDLLQRILRRAQPDPLDVPRRGRAAARLRLQALEREREVRAALGGGDGVDLVDDHRLDAAEHLARARGEDQVQRLGRRDQDVGRLAHHRGALALGRVAGADAHAHVLGARFPRSGARRLRSMSYASAFSGLMYTTRVRRAAARLRQGDSAGAAGGSSAHRNAASVLPDPVGADSSTCSPLAIAGHAWACAGVGRVEGLLEPLAHAGAEAGKGHARG